VKRWPTPFIYASELAIEPNGRRAYCVHGLVNGMRGKNHGRNLPYAEQDVSTVWNIADGALVTTLETSPRLVQSAARLPDGSGQLCARHGKAWYLLALPSGACLDSDSFPYDWDKDGPSPQVLPGGNVLLTLQGGKLVVWDVAARRRRATLCGAVHTKVLAVDARGEHCVYRTAEGRAFLARLSDGEVVQQLEECTGGEAISFAAFGAPGRTLALVLEGQAVCTVAL